MGDNFKKTYTDLIRNLYAQSEQVGPYSQYKNYLVSSDGTFLGKLSSNKYDALSIFNEYGRFGSTYSNLCIFNEYSKYGSKYSSQSPFNEYASNPPKIYLDNKYYGLLTINEYQPQAVNTHEFLEKVRTESKFAY